MAKKVVTVSEYKKITVLSSKQVENAMDIALQISIMRKEFSLAKSKAKQIEYALQLFEIAVEQGHISRELLAKIK
jgi:hypothetical protein